MLIKLNSQVLKGRMLINLLCWIAYVELRLVKQLIEKVFKPLCCGEAAEASNEANPHKVVNKSVAV